LIRGLYTASSGMMVEMNKNDISASNLANVNTTGYKRDTVVTGSFPEMLLQRVNDQRLNDVSRPPAVGNLGTGAIVDEVVTVYEQGQLRESTNPFDLAISGDGFFTVSNQNGTFLTRNGSFTLDSEGYLVTSRGDMVQGEAGPIRLNDAADIEVDSSGTIKADGMTVATLRLVTVADTAQLTKAGDSLFTGGQAVAGITGQVRQRFVEGSNVNVITEMVNMITIMRAYEANQRIISGYDSTLSQAMDVGRK